MSQRRMFSNRIANSAKFLQMPTESQLLYFHMILRADDDGIVESYPIMKLLGTASDNLKVLEAKGFVRRLNDDQVVVIVDWLEHNKIRADRKVDSIYLPLLITHYPESEIISPKPRSDVADNSKRIPEMSTVSPRSAQVRLGKVSKDMDASPSVSLVTEVRNVFKELGCEYQYNGKQASHCKQLSTRYKLDPDMFKRVITTFQGMRRTDKFYAKHETSPSTINCFWDKIMVQVQEDIGSVTKKTVQPVCFEEQMMKIRHLLRNICRETEMTDAEIDRAYNDIDLCNREWGKEWREHLTDETKGWMI